MGGYRKVWAPDAAGSLEVWMVGGTPAGCGAVLNVVDITVVPEPGTLLLLAGAAILRRRR